MKKEFILNAQSMSLTKGSKRGWKTIRLIRKQLLLCFALLIGISGFAQKTISAVSITEEISIDGKFAEEAWSSQVDVAKDFTAAWPVPNQTPRYPTEVKVIYDDEAIYISAFMKEASKDSIQSQLMLRDQIGNTDFFGVIFDTYGNGNNGFEFILSCTGVQFDAKLTPQNEDSSWDAVWFGATEISDTGWTAEMKIPYSALRFPSDEIQKWNVNFLRRRAANAETSYFNNVDFEQDNPVLTQIASLTGDKRYQTSFEAISYTICIFIRSA